MSVNLSSRHTMIIRDYDSETMYAVAAAIQRMGWQLEEREGALYCLGGTTAMRTALAHELRRIGIVATPLTGES